VTTNIPPEIADNVPAPAPVRISPEVRETILESLRLTKNRLVERVSQVGVSSIRRPHLVSQIEGVQSAIAFVEELP